QPQSQTAVVGSSPGLSVSLQGTTPLSYQWQLNGTNLPGATAASLMLTNVQLSQAGNYSVTASNALGSATSSNAVLTVISVPTCLPAPLGLVSWWPAENNA